MKQILGKKSTVRRAAFHHWESDFPKQLSAHTHLQIEILTSHYLAPEKGNFWQQPLRIWAKFAHVKSEEAPTVCPLSRIWFCKWGRATATAFANNFGSFSPSSFSQFLLLNCMPHAYNFYNFWKKEVKLIKIYQRHSIETLQRMTLTYWPRMHNGV